MLQKTNCSVLAGSKVSLVKRERRIANKAPYCATQSVLAAVHRFRFTVTFSIASLRHFRQHGMDDGACSIIDISSVSVHLLRKRKFVFYVSIRF